MRSSYLAVSLAVCLLHLAPPVHAQGAAVQAPFATAQAAYRAGTTALRSMDLTRAQDALEQALKAYAPPSGVPVVVNSQLGPFNGAIGAAALAVHEWKPLER